MSLVNSFINQIGRELGKDVYRHVTSQPNRMGLTESKLLLNVFDEVKSFELANYDKVTLRKLSNLVEKVSSVSHNNFMFHHIFGELDRKIDFVRDNISADFKDEVDILDNKNESNLKTAFMLHKDWVSELVENNKNKKEKTTKFLPFYLKRVWGIGHLIVLFLLFKSAGFTFVGSFSSTNQHVIDNIPGVWCIIYFVLVFLPSFIISMVTRSNRIKNNKIIKERSEELENYLIELV